MSSVTHTYETDRRACCMPTGVHRRRGVMGVGTGRQVRARPGAFQHQALLQCDDQESPVPRWQLQVPRAAPGLWQLLVGL